MQSDERSRLYALHDACSSGNEDLVKDLVNSFPVNKKYIIDLPDPNYETPLFHAIRTDRIAIARFLLDRGARINHGIVFQAVRKANPYMLQLLSEYGADFAIHTNSERWTVLHDAVCLHNNDVIDFLVKQGVDVNAPDNCGITPLCIALTRTNKTAVQKLLDLNADINKVCDSIQEYLPIHIAAMMGHLEYFSMFIDSTIDLNKLTNNKQTSLDTFVSYLCFSHPPMPVNVIWFVIYREKSKDVF